MKCLMEIDSQFGLSWDEKLAYLSYRFTKMQQRATPVKHFFEGGTYVREMFIPAETLFVGRPHRYGHRVDLVVGRVLLIEEHRKVHLDAPYSMHSTPGYQTVFYTKTDVVGRTYHPNPTGSQDLESLEDEAFLPVNDLVIKGALVRNRIRAQEAERQGVVEYAL